MTSLRLPRALFLTLFFTWAALLRAAAPDAIVAADGSAKYTSIQQAILDLPQNTTRDHPWTILVKPGTYREIVYVQREKRHVRLIGEDAATTTLVYNLNANLIGLDQKPIGTYRTPTFILDADDFTAENITFQNDAGNVGQALAIRIDGDRAVFRRCRFLGWQDTIFINRGRQYFEDCLIAGAVDFIFGGATAWFENCDIRIDGKGYITAASTPASQEYGYVFNKCRISASAPGFTTFLARPWRGYAATIFMHTEMSEVVEPAGWHNWGKPDREATVRYQEFANTGLGADRAKRVSWSHLLTDSAAAELTVRRVLGGADSWSPQDQR